jgi:hypothetical protein
MQTEIINKFGNETVKNFWVFIESLNFDNKKQDAAVVRDSLLKKLSPSVADKYKKIADEFAFSLYRGAFYDKQPIYLYASFDAVAKGLQFYNECWENSDLLEESVKTADQFNNFASCIPTEDDYFHSVIPSPESIMDDFEEYDDFQNSNGNVKERKDLDWKSIE